MRENPEGQILTEIEGDVGLLTISNPLNRNAMNLFMYHEIPSAISQLIKTGARVIIIQGQGNEAFGSGSDISEFAELRTPENAEAYDQAEANAHNAIASAAIPTIAMIHGACRGGGLAIALSCDLRVASETATFAAPPAKLGIAFPHEAVESLTHTVGDSNARYLLLTAATIDAHEAYRIGLIHGISQKSKLKEDVDSIVSKICQLAPRSLSAAKTSLANIKGKSSQEDVRRASSACYSSNDYQEGITAFIEKRTPDFDGT